MFQVVSCYFTSLFDSSVYRTPILHTYTLCILRAYCTSTHYSYYGKIPWLVPVKPGSTVTPLLFFSFFLRFFLSSVIACHLPLVLLAGIIYISVHYSSALFLHRLFFFPLSPHHLPSCGHTTVSGKSPSAYSQSACSVTQDLGGLFFHHCLEAVKGI